MSININPLAEALSKLKAQCGPPDQEPTYLLNIGMDRNDGTANTDGQLMVALLRSDIIHMGEVSYVQSNTERTAVVQMEKEPHAMKVEHLCELLGQESSPCTG